MKKVYTHYLLFGISESESEFSTSWESYNSIPRKVNLIKEFDKVASKYPEMKLRSQIFYIKNLTTVIN